MTVEPIKKVAGTRPAGETWVWFTSLGLSIGLLMVFGLLALIVANGIGVFWPHEIRVVELKTGAVPAGRTNIVAGIIADIREKHFARESGATNQRPAQVEWHLLMGNRDIYGASFRYVNTQDIAFVKLPKSALFVERMEYGPAICEAVELKTGDGRIVKAGEADFEKSFISAVDEAGERRAEIRHLERIEIGKINHEMERLRLRAKESAAASNETTTAQAALEKQHHELAAKATKLREQHAAAKFTYRLFTGEEKTMNVGDIVGFHRPNDMGFGAQLGHFFHRLWLFVSEEPREANTEGGIFPAIFGTFVMTLLMSIAVTPFGVLAAIYLREYAKQGLFVRMVRISVNNLAGVPSIVFGVFGLGFFVYVLGGSIDEMFFSSKLPTPTFGTGGILWAALTLALMTVPVVIVATEEALAAVPRGAREGSLALGASKWQTISRVVLPASAPGILTGLVLAMARGAGEVAPLMLVGVVKLAPSLPIDHLAPFVHLDQKFMHLGFHIYDLGFQSPDSDAARPMVFATTFFLILLVVLLNLGAIIVRERLRRRFSTGAF